MKAVAALVLLLINVRLSHSCSEVEQVSFCTEIPSAFRPGLSTLLLAVKDVGEINSTVLRSDDLISVTSLIINNAAVTGIAEGAFSSFMHLTDLSLNQNFLIEINPKWFGRPDILGELSLSENHIEVLHESNLKGFSNLMLLNLSKNRIRTIDPNSFSSNTILAELDLSGNRMTRLSPQVFGSLRFTKIRLDGNPWDCSCGVGDFVDFLKELQSRSLLDRQAEVTCASPPSLRGQPVWNVSVCVMTPPPSVTQTAHRKPTSAKVVTTPPSETKTSVQPTDAPVTMSSNTARPPARPTSETKPSVTPKPSDILTTVTTSTLNSGAFAAHVTSPPSVTEISVRPEPSDLPRATSTPAGLTEMCATSRPSSDANVVFTLVVVIVVLSLLLFVGFFLAVLHRRKRNSKAVTPGRPEEDRPELKEDGRSSRAPSPGCSEKRGTDQWDSETGWRTSFTGVRAKSANAVLFLSPFCAPVKDEVTLQTETEAQSEDGENQAGGKQKRGDEAEVDGGVDTDDADVIRNVKQAEAGGDLDENSLRVSVNTNTVAYLSIGTNQNKLSPDDFNKPSTDGSAQRSKTGKVMGRISTWPPTAVQWQARCKAKEEEEEQEGSDVFTVWTSTFPAEVKTVLKTEERPSGSAWDKKEDDIENNLMEGLRTAPNQDPLKMTAAPVKLGLSQSSKPNEDTTCFSEALTHTGTRIEEQLKEEEIILDPTTVGWTQTLNEGKLSPDQDLKSAANRAQKKKSSTKADQRSDSKRAVTSRRRAENGPKAPSGGASPDDETLLSGNEYAFMDLLHEVVQNNGRWTRDRWKQKEANKQRRHDRATEGV